MDGVWEARRQLLVSNKHLLIKKYDHTLFHDESIFRECDRQLYECHNENLGDEFTFSFIV